MAWVGHIESAHAPVPNMRFTLEQQRPNKTRFEVNALGQKTVRVFDGTQGWKLRAAQNVGRPDAQPFAAEELKFTRAGQGIDRPLIDSAAKGNLVTLEGLDEIEGHTSIFETSGRCAQPPGSDGDRASSAESTARLMGVREPCDTAFASSRPAAARHGEPATQASGPVRPSDSTSVCGERSGPAPK
jgi:hypothetical protein